MCEGAPANVADVVVMDQYDGDADVASELYNPLTPLEAAPRVICNLICNAEHADADFGEKMIERARDREQRRASRYLACIER